MAGDSIIGALRVDLGLNTAQFDLGLKSVQGGLNKFGVQLTLGLDTIARAVGRVVTAMPDAIKGAIDHAAALDRAAQKAGTTVDALSRLAYAASFSEVGLDDLTSSLGKLSKQMADATQNSTGVAASAFAALGISVTDTNGRLRDAGDVFKDIADRFSRINDGATKTAIAMALFGKTGAQLIPLLNEGTAGLRRFASESDRTGNTISTKTAEAANHFNDTLTKLQMILSGVINKLAQDALPTLQALADKIVSLNPEIAKWTTLLGGVAVALVPIGIGISALTPIVSGLTAGVVALNTSLLALIGTLGSPVLLAGLGLLASTSPAGAGEDALVHKLKLNNIPDGGAFSKGGWGSQGLTQPSEITVAGGNASDPNMDLGLFTGGLKKAQESIDPFQARMEELAPVLTKLHDPFQQVKDDLTDLKTMFDNGAITAQQYGEAVTRTNLNAVGSFADMAAGVTGALSDLFKNNKAFAVSNAVLQGLSGVAYALGSAAPPWNFINAAAVGIEAAANVASILSTNENSTSMPGSSSAGSSSTTAAPQSPATTVYLQGQSFSGEQVADLLKTLISDGGGGSLVDVIRAN